MKDFYQSREWRRLRYQVLMHYGRQCQCCNAKDKPLHVDHIKPVSKYPELKLEITNLQILCEDCNIGKSNLDESDFRDERTKLNVVKIPPVIYGFMVSKTGVAHIWNGKDSLCRMWSTNGLRRDKYEFVKNHNGEICKICTKVRNERGKNGSYQPHPRIRT